MRSPTAGVYADADIVGGGEMTDTLSKLTRAELIQMIHGEQDIQYHLYKSVENHKADAARLADELRIVLLKAGVVWEEAGESSPALILHDKLLNREGK
jgi:hypothetical protein